MAFSEKLVKTILILYLLITGIIEARRSLIYYKYQEFSLPFWYNIGITIRKYISGSSSAEQLKIEFETSSWVILTSVFYAITAPVAAIYLFLLNE